MTVAEAIRVTYPRLRRTGVVGIVHNGGSKRVYQCCECGACDSMSNAWPVPKHVRQFIAEHESTCGSKLVASVSQS
jgi:hypothetical protein